MRSIATILIALATFAFSPAPPSQAAADCAGSVVGGGSHFFAGLTCYQPRASQPGPTSNAGYVNPGYLGNGSCLTGFVAECFSVPGLPGITPDVPLGFLLPGQAAPVPQVGGGQVLQAFRRIPLPAPRSKTQPATKTLVNFDTIFYVDADGFTRTITLLGRRVDLDITPSSYTWTWGDGSTVTTDRPGSPYPAKDVVHRYPHGDVTVAHHVSITWSARFRVDGGPWRDVPGTATSTGPATDLRIAEAVPVLSGDY